MLVRVPDVSLDLFFANAQQLNEAVRELWTVIGDADGNLPLTADDAAATEDILRKYRPQRDTLATQAFAARDRGDSTFTIELELPASAVTEVEHLIDLLDRVDQLCAAEQLALPASPELRDFRRSLLGEIARQLRAG